MKRPILYITTSIVFLLLAVSFLGGTVFWRLFTGYEDLNIDGRPEIARTAVPVFADQWPSYGGDSGGSRYSAADQINLDNVEKLDVAWRYQTGAFEGREELIKRTAFEATPILVEDTLIFCTPFNDVIAIDPGDGHEKWRHDPEVALDGRPANDFTCRGVAYWKDQTATTERCASRIFMGTVDSRLIALDAKSGSLCAEFGEGGEVQIEPSISLRWPGEYQITSAPAITGDTVIIGSAISDNLRTVAPSGVVKAFDARTGAEKWSFDPVPRHPDDPARATWEDGSADRVGHANVWSSMSVDDERGLIFLPTSSASPDFYGGVRPGDNLYTNSVVALDGETGEVVWHFQTVHHDVWDYDVPAQPGAYQVWRDGKAHDVIAQVTKTGLVFVLDRETGEPFLPIEERAVPQGGAEGEKLSATQPFPVNTPPIVPNTVSPDDAFGITLWDKNICAAKIKKLRREGLFTPPSTQGTLVYPFTGGGANWGSAAFDAARNLLIVNMSNAGHAITLIPNEDAADITEVKDGAEIAPMEGAPYAMTRALLASPIMLPCTPPPWGVLAAVDLESGAIVWRKTFGTTRDLAPFGITLKTGTPNFGGPMITASGLIFIGAAMDNYLRAFDIESGEELWKGRLPAGGQATPMSYEWQGRQYVVIAAGGHGKSTTTPGDYVIAFALPEE